MLLVQVTMEREIWLLMVPTLLAASQLLNGLQPPLVVVISVLSTQEVRAPALVLFMMDFAPALKVVLIAPVPRATCS